LKWEGGERNGKGGAGWRKRERASWNRAADWLRPALILLLARYCRRPDVDRETGDK